MKPKADKSGVEFSVLSDARAVGQNAAARREHDKRLGAGTMSRSGAKCPCCETIMTMEDLRLEGRAGRLAVTMTAVITDGRMGKEYRIPTLGEREAAENARAAVPQIFEAVPFGLPTENTPKGGSGASRAFSVDGYGLDQWHKVFLPRQLAALGTFVKAVRAELADASDDWSRAVTAYCALGIDRLADRSSSLCRPDP